MNFIESETIELKSIVVNDICKEVIAFANCKGGVIYIGINDDGSVKGVTDTNHTILQINNMLKDSIKPDITMFVNYEVIIIEEKSIIKLIVQKGTNRPYYLANKGLKAGGVYVRNGTSTDPATDSFIRKIIKETDGESFESMRALQQNLTFNKLQQQFEKYQLAFDASKRITLGLENNDSIYTNLAILLSDQCQSTIKVATFAGTDKNIFTDRREFSGSLFKQMEELYDYLELRNELKASFNGLYRSDKRNYPPQAIREAMLNCIVHRDYALSAATLVSVFEDRIEFISPGGLVNGVELADIMLGLSVCRNPKLAAVFYRLQLIEAYGTGIAKIMSAYDDSVLKPKIEVTPNAFKITLPNLNYLAKIHDDDLQDNDYKKAIISYISYHTIAYRKDIDKLLGTSQSTSSRLLKLMIKQDLIYAIGKGKNIHYKIKKHS